MTNNAMIRVLRESAELIAWAVKAKKQTRNRNYKNDFTEALTCQMCRADSLHLILEGQ